MSFVVGLTGSIGMGKTTTAGLFADRGVPVWDADGAVHRLYAANGAATRQIGALFPDVIEKGAVSRTALKARIAANPDILASIETIVHPLVAKERQAFLSGQTAPIVLLDIPLLFEIGADKLCDATAVVSTSPDLQKARVLARNTMSAETFDLILSRQMPDAEKRARADYIIDTTTPQTATAAVEDILSDIQNRLEHA